MMSQGTIDLINYLKTIGDANMTAADVAEAMGLDDKRKVDGSFTSGLCRKGLGYRVEAEVELEDGSHCKVKFLKLTEAGKNFDPNATEAAE